MKTLVAMVSVGDRKNLTNVSYRRAYRWAAKRGYDSILVSRNMGVGDRPVQFNKTRIPKEFPDYERYCILDDDLLVSKEAPNLPKIEEGNIGLCEDVYSKNTKKEYVRWTGNTGFMVVPKSSVDLLKKAYKHGPEPSIWPPGGDQSALNHVAWKEGRVQRIDCRWNLQPVLSYIRDDKGWERWKSSRVNRLLFYSKVALRIPNSYYEKIRNAWGVHMIRGRYPKFFDFVMV
jgi:hypothetical protein